ncbi:hypothetical protein [Myceligenerans xiligouense]|uniref:Uncharacterized protein n=1 Tax=Myceligenerans xiligouense TaxID=253184 RepID=A0A3N4YW16_9MICO|nr:hypothetical protein [Myceligenerans xiligouense]RPF22830.1 hypothetical protein EDD34_3504 [Myceligenerans xiligouense]
MTNSPQESMNLNDHDARRPPTLGIGDVLDLTASLLSAVGGPRVELFTATRNHVCLQPRDLADGEAIARLLGCDRPLDHHLLTPGCTVWTGELDGVEVEVRAELRRPAGAVR